ncbi:MAG: GNAT family N-acetyltransferase [Acidimicrobiales bacterium]
MKIVDNAAELRFEAETEAGLAYLDYKRRGRQLILVHTHVPDALRGMGIGGELVRASIDAAQSGDLSVLPQCSFARSWLATHPDAAATIQVDWQGE